MARQRHPICFPFEVLNSETSAANLLEQVRWRDGLQCPRCRSESVINYGSYREYQRYLCKVATTRSTTRRSREHVREPRVAGATVALATSRRLKRQTDSVSQTVPTSATNPPQTGSRGTDRDCPSSPLTHQQWNSQEQFGNAAITTEVRYSLVTKHYRRHTTVNSAGVVSCTV